MSDLLLVLTGAVLVLTVVAAVLLGRDRLSPWAAPARDGVRPDPAPAAPLVLPEHPTPADVARIGFRVRRRGYDPAEVHAVLEHLARRLPDRADAPAPRA